jgi:glycosyltransferase involved in cell wall biosynthesis
MEENTGLVSICMPAYNAGAYLLQTVTSIQNQSYKNWELIIVNDGSTDNTGIELAKIDDSRIRIIQQENHGQSHAANVAFSYSRGPLIKFMDADDLISVNYLEKQFERLGSDQESIVSASWGRFYDNDLSTFKLVNSLVSKDLTPVDWLTNAWMNADPMMQCALWLIPRPVIERSGLWDESLSLINDLDFFTRVILSSKKVLFEEKAILYYRSGIPGSLSNTKSEKAFLSASRSIDQATTELLSADNSKRSMLACANSWQQFIYDIYPQYPRLISEAEKKVSAFGGSSLKFKCGGVTRVFVIVIGWKLTKRLKYTIYRLNIR